MLFLMVLSDSLIIIEAILFVLESGDYYDYEPYCMYTAIIGIRRNLMDNQHRESQVLLISSGRAKRQ
jgi:hypothetical protein